MLRISRDFYNLGNSAVLSVIVWIGIWKARSGWCMCTGWCLFTRLSKKEIDKIWIILIIIITDHLDQMSHWLGITLLQNVCLYLHKSRKFSNINGIVRSTDIGIGGMNRFFVAEKVPTESLFILPTLKYFRLTIPTCILHQ